MDDKVRLLSFNCKTGEFNEFDAGELDDYYRELECDCFDIVTRQVGLEHRIFDIFCDDNGLFVEHPVASAFDSHGNCMLVGNLVFAHSDKEGNTTGLSDDDIQYIKDSKIMYADTKSGVVAFAITPVEY